MTRPHVGVVIPARDEEQLLPRCLAAVAAAVAALKGRVVPAEVSVAVVLDSCTDGSARAAAQAGRRLGLDLHLLQTDAGSVGAARHVGTAAMLGLGAQWIAVTDADTVVPASWLVIQLGFADAGYELVLGTVEPDAADLSAEHLARWHAEHRLTEGHPHIHGANMAFSARAYTAAGGFEPLHIHEDVQLVSRIRAAGAGWTATDRMRAVTSGRLDGRVPAGFSGYLRRLGA
ncbi:glycosyltransferase [Arthrobacter zhangbolii]|uniref:Glycosyltransferase n=1 Tax=Arthrobacter zhangbolii TaxID=2886936 RepID=A0A9X1M9M9_9MICC|nr:glycosyltransferase [Arthrobacter zhangbolii]MCC3273586.1 glycosyltransferase [Arthrobacter zhangbolii]UON92395.1 glycosyltransferase [Arthrobacter zhangbolii]